MSTQGRIFTGLLASAIVAGCGPVARSDASGASSSLVPTRTVVDGIPILTHPANAFEHAPQFTLDTTPLAVLGGGEADAQFDLTRVSSVVALGDGRYATFGSVGAQLMIFDANGEPQHNWGGQGEGPGFFVAGWGILPVGGDTLLVIDIGNRRRNWVTADRGVVRQERYEPKGQVMGLTPAGILRDRSIVAFDPTLRSRLADTAIRFPVRMARMSRQADTITVIDSLPGIELRPQNLRAGSRTVRQMTPVYLDRFPQVVAWDSVIASSDNRAYQIDLRDRSGKVRSRIVVNVPARAVDPAMREAFIVNIQRHAGPGENGSGRVDTAAIRRHLLTVPFADTLGVIGRFFVDSQQHLWVLDQIAPGDTAWHATAYREDGSIVGQLIFDGIDRPVAITGDRVIVRHEDDDGVVSFRVYRIRAPQ